MSDIHLLAGLTVAVLILAGYGFGQEYRTTAQQLAFFLAFVVAMAWLLVIVASA